MFDMLKLGLQINYYVDESDFTGVQQIIFNGETINIGECVHASDEQ